MNPGVVDNFLNVFTTYIDSGFGLLQGNVAYLSSTLIAIDITLAGLFWAWGADEDIVARLVKKTLCIGFFAYIIGNFNTLAGIIFNSFAGLGLEAAGSNLSASELVQPGRFAQVGIDAYRRYGYSMRDARGRVPNHRSDGQFRTAELASDAREGAAQHEWRDTLEPCHGAVAVERAPHRRRT